MGEIGLGLEHLDRDGTGSLVSTVRAAVDGGANFLDLTIFTPEARDRMGEALRGIRDRVLLAGHLGYDPTDETRSPLVRGHRDASGGRLSTTSCGGWAPTASTSRGSPSSTTSKTTRT